MRNGKALNLLYLWAVIVGGAVLLAELFPAIDFDFSTELAVLIMMAMIMEWLLVSLPYGQLSSGYAVVFGAFLIFGPATAAWISALGTMFGQGIMNRGNPMRTTLFNSAQSVVAVYGASLVYRFSGGVPAPGELLTLSNTGPLFLFSAIFFLLNNLLVYLYLWPKHQLSRVDWWDALRWEASTYLYLVPLGFLVALLYHAVGFSGALLILLLGLVVQFFLRRYLAVELANRELGVLYEVARRLATNVKPDNLLHIILQETRRIVPYHTAAIYLWSEERQLFVPSAVNSPYVRELNDTVWGYGEGIVGRAVAAREPYLIPDTWEDAHLSREPGLFQFLRSLMVIPLVAENEVLGVFILGDRHPDIYTEHNLHNLTIVGGQVAMAVDNARLHRRMEQIAGHDYLTGLPNRALFLRYLQSQLTASRREDRPLALILLDVNGLRNLNWRYGYLVGDHALRQMARMLEDGVRPPGMVVRYGGGGFAVLLPNTGEIRALETAERFQEAIEQISFGDEDREERGWISVQVGWAVSPLDGVKVDELVQRAERKLYRCREPWETAAVVQAGENQNV